MAQARPKRKKRKRGGAHRGVTRPSTSAPARSSRLTALPREERRHGLLGGYGEPPPSPFGGLPVSEFLIFVGGLGALVGLISKASPVLVVGIVLCLAGVLEFTVREHFTGYRSHAMLLAAVPAVALVVVGAVVFGTPRQRSARELMLAAALPVFGLLFWYLRKRFWTARQARMIRRPVA